MKKKQIKIKKQIVKKTAVKKHDCEYKRELEQLAYEKEFNIIYEELSKANDKVDNLHFFGSSQELKQILIDTNYKFYLIKFNELKEKYNR